MVNFKEEKLNELKEQVHRFFLQECSKNLQLLYQFLSDLRKIYASLCFIKQHQKKNLNKIYLFRLNQLLPFLETDFARQITKNFFSNEIIFLKKFIKDILFGIKVINVKFYLKFNLENKHKQILNKILVKKYKISPGNLCIVTIENVDGKLIDHYLLEQTEVEAVDLDYLNFTEEEIHRKMFDIFAYKELFSYENGGANINYNVYIAISKGS